MPQSSNIIMKSSLNYAQKGVSQQKVIKLLKPKNPNVKKIPKDLNKNQPSKSKLKDPLNENLENCFQKL